MGTFTFAGISDVFPVGTIVGAYAPRSNPETGRPAGEALVTARVAVDGSLTFDSDQLEFGTEYVAWAGVAGQLRTFWTAPVPQLTDDDATVVRDKTLRRQGSGWPTPEGKEVFHLDYSKGRLFRRGPLMDNQSIPGGSTINAPDAGRSVNRFRPAPYVGMSYGGNGPGLVVWTRDEPNLGDYTGGQGWDIYRHSLPPNAKVVRYGVRAAFDSAWGDHSVRDYMLGIDTCLPDGTRRFFQLRRAIVDPNSGVNLDVWQVASQPDGGGALTFRTIPNSGTAFPGYNEHKLNDIVIEFDVDLAHDPSDPTVGGIVGLRIGMQSFGSRASSGDKSLAVLPGPPASVLATFPNGFNFCKIVTNRQDGAPWGSRAHLPGNYQSRSKMVVFEEWCQVVKDGVLV